MQPIGVTLRILREELGFSRTEVAESLSVRHKPTNRNMISSWERGESMPNALQLLHLCGLYQVENAQETFFGKEKGNRLNEAGRRKLREYAEVLEGMSLYTVSPEPELPRKLPLYDIPVSAGSGEYLDSDNYELTEVGDEVPQAADYGVRISGDSMYPLFANKQVVWVKQQRAVENGDIGIFYYMGDSYIKKLEVRKDGMFLVSVNPEYKPIKIVERDEFRVFGKVIG